MAVTRLSDLNRNDIEDNGASTKGSFRVRPSGYQYPNGLKTVAVVEPNTHITTTNATINAYGPSSDPTKVSYSWTTTGTFHHNAGFLPVDILIVAGGGAGHTADPANGGAGGGGAGGLIYYSDSSGLTGPPGPASANSKSPNGSAFTLESDTTFTVTVGSGGTASPTPSVPSPVGPGNGQDSSITAPQSIYNLVATGGGCQDFGSFPSIVQPGGSGGGAGPGSNGVGGSGVAGQGNPGGGVTPGSPFGFSGGGGGGAGGPGSNENDLNLRSGKDGNPAPTLMPGHPGVYNDGKRYSSGGDGLDFDISGTTRTYAAGGGGSGRTFGWFGGSDNLGGRGSGSDGAYNPSTGLTAQPWSPTNFGGNGTVNRGSGGGGGAYGGNGGSGIVVMQFKKDSTINFTFDVN